MMRKLVTFVFVLLCISVQAITLYPNKSKMAAIYYSDSSNLYFKFDNTNFLWNNEYFNDVISGYTLIGYNLSPSFQYHFSPHFKLELGAHLLKYSGVDDFSNILPRYAVVYHKNRMSFSMGSIFSGEYHKLSDVVYNYERNFTHNQENGVQFRLDRPRLFLDVWLDWQTFIFRGDNKQEELVAGISTAPVIIEKNEWVLSSPAFFLVTHKGGQINEGEHKMLTAYNYGLGLNALKALNGDLLTGVSAEAQYMGFIDNSPETVSIYKNGLGILANVKLHHYQSFFQLGYWNSHRFLSLIGNPIYQSYSEKGDGFHKENRSLFTSQLYYSKQLFNGIYLGLMGETFYDLEDGFFDYSMGVKITINSQFFLTKVNLKQ